MRVMDSTPQTTRSGYSGNRYRWPRFNGDSIESSEDLTGLLGEEAIGKKAKLSVLRGGNVVELAITPTTGREE